MFDRNVTPYRKLNEVIDEINDHSKALYELQLIFVELRNDGSVWGWFTRFFLGRWINRFSITRVNSLKHIDIPPVTIGTLEINNDGIRTPQGDEDAILSKRTVQGDSGHRSRINNASQFAGRPIIPSPGNRGDVGKDRRKGDVADS